MRWEVKQDNCLDVMREMDDNSVDAIVTDPPYGLSFMGKKWDYDVPSVDIWRECLRVLKPGGHLLAFAGTRTQHRMAVNIEDAGFDIRDMIAWVYGSGFPKSLDVSKAIDKCNGEPNRLHKFTAWMRTTGLTSKRLDEITGTNMGGHYTTAKSQPAIPTAALWKVIRPHIKEVPEWVDELVARIEAEREVVGRRIGVDTSKQTIACATAAQGLDKSTKREFDVTAPATEAARQWQGWGTALKPALEPITVARKPLGGTVASNVLEHGTGAMNIDGCRVGADEAYLGGSANPAKKVQGSVYGWANSEKDVRRPPNNQGRWPANLIHDGSDEVVGLFPATAASNSGGKAGWQDSYVGGKYKPVDRTGYDEPAGSAARFFYCAKASKRDRDEGCERNNHPTVKPTDLMRYLVRLVTPPDGLVLDPFCGSGSTGKAAVLEGFRFIGAELDPDYCEIARARIAAVDPDEVLK